MKSRGRNTQAAEQIAGSDWSREEVATIVADYLSMLTLELAGQAFNKSARRRHLKSCLPIRSEGSIEFKHANISAVMLELGFPYLTGYKPRSNFQRQMLLDEVASQVAKLTVLDEAALVASQRPVVTPDCSDFSRVIADAPKKETRIAEPQRSYLAAPIKRDYLEREAHNRSLGAAGEEFALSYERWRLAKLGADQLADRVVHASKVEGDGLGYDIRSFEPDGRARFIEVKTTGFGERTPFFVSANELTFSRSNSRQYHLYRLFDFRKAPRLFKLDGAIEEHCRLDPSTFRASFG